MSSSCVFPLSLSLCVSVSVSSHPVYPAIWRVTYVFAINIGWRGEEPPDDDYDNDCETCCATFLTFINVRMCVWVCALSHKVPINCLTPTCLLLLNLSFWVPNRNVSSMNWRNYRFHVHTIIIYASYIWLLCSCQFNFPNFICRIKLYMHIYNISNTMS